VQFIGQSETLPNPGRNNTHYAITLGIQLGFLALGLLLAVPKALANPPQSLQQYLQQQPISRVYSGSTRAITQWEIEYFYASRGYRPVWQHGNRLTQLRKAIADLRGDGLRPEEYPVPSPQTIALPDSEVIATASWLQAAIDLHLGRLDRNLIEPIWRKETQYTRRSLLTSMRRLVGNPQQALESLRPQSSAYRTLRESYVKGLAERNEPPWPSVPYGETLRPGDRNERVKRLRQRLVAEGDSFQSLFGENFFDSELTNAVKRFQYRHSLAEDGEVGKATLAALNIPRSARLEQIRANLERWRWLDQDLEDHLLIVNIAGASLRYLVDGKEVWHTRTLVGRNSRPTPSLKSVVSYLTVNPDWTIPPTIFKEDKLPKIKQDHDYLEKHNLQAIKYDGTPLNPATINWDNPRGVMLRLPPGPQNPLGKVVVRFPNPFSVYLHDTPNKSLFGKARRAGSSGCVRVENAVELAYLLLDRAGTQPLNEVDELFSDSAKRNIGLIRDIPILMDYWTAGVDAEGNLIYQPDIYERDAALIQALNR
jgi:L,D-transpeptidase YcbB